MGTCRHECVTSYSASVLAGLLIVHESQCSDSIMQASNHIDAYVHAGLQTAARDEAASLARIKTTNISMPLLV
jgi:hypothetical protein